jgi:hypothetical protein
MVIFLSLAASARGETPVVNWISMGPNGRLVYGDPLAAGPNVSWTVMP